MPSSRWIQHPITMELIPRDEYVRPKEAIHSIFEDFKGFVSPIDGSIVSGRKAYEEHCRKHNVVNAANFTPEYYEKKAAERSVIAQGNTKEEKLHIRREIYETWTQAERNYGSGS